MLPIRTVLHPTDFSDQSEFAFRLACTLARDYGARLTLLHVAEPPVIAGGEGALLVTPVADLKSLKEKLRQLRPAEPNVPTDYRVVEGFPAPEILRLAEAEKYDVLVLGTHGRTGLSRLLMGSVAEQVVRRAPCPVVTVKAPPSEATPPGEATPEAAGNLTGAAKG